MTATNGHKNGNHAQTRVTSDIFDRVPPHSPEAEMGVLGSIMLAGGAMEIVDDVLSCLRPEDFYDDANGRIFRHAADSHSQGKQFDVLLFSERLQDSGDYEVCGGTAYLGRILNSVPNCSHAMYYAGIVREKSILRSVLMTGAEMVRLGYETGATATEAMAFSEREVFAIGERGIADTRPMSFSQMMADAIEAIDARRGTGATGIKTGIIELDKMMGGLKPGQLAIIAGRPSMGKTALAHNIVEYAARDYSTLFISLEMGAVELTERILSSQGRIDSYRLRHGSITTEERARMVATSARLAKLKINIVDTPSMTVSQISAFARRMRRKDGLDLLVIDYLNLIEPDNHRDPRQEQVAKISRRLKLLAKELHVPIICLCQLNRQTESTKDNKPKLSHLRESGAIEQDADIVMFCHRPAYYKNENTKPGEAEAAELILGKQRNGPTGEMAVLWFPSYTQWANTERSETQAGWKASRCTGDGESRADDVPEYRNLFDNETEFMNG